MGVCCYVINEWPQLKLLIFQKIQKFQFQLNPSFIQSTSTFHEFQFFRRSSSSSITSHCMISLNNRPLNVSNGTLLVSLSNGRIQVWSHHDNSKCYIADFNAIHVADDVSKWLIDVHSPNYIFFMYWFYWYNSLFSLHDFFFSSHAQLHTAE